MTRKQQAIILRKTRKFHRIMGINLLLLFLLISISGLLLGWKKNSNGWILPETHQAKISGHENQLPLDTLQTIASRALHDAVGKHLSTKIDRIDVRPDKGIVKFIFKHHYWGVQVVTATGEVVSIRPRRHDFIENLHDGSILDHIFNTRGEILKLFYTTFMGFSLISFTLTGFWLWYGPRLLKRSRKIKK
jgi:uncharacterized iron-regulated membrane protein